MIRRTGPISRLTPPKKRRSKPRRAGVDRDPGYLAWLRERSCVACKLTGCTGRAHNPGNWASVTIDPAHGPVNGMRSKGPDSGAIPLCRHHHEEQHQIGWPAFQQKYSFSLEKEAAAHFALYLIVRDSDGQR